MTNSQDTTCAPLERFRVVGITEQTAVIAAGTPEAREVAAGSCWHCGTTIRICVLAKNIETGEVVTVGTTCAERIGLDKAELKQYLAERFAEQRKAASAAARKAQQERYEALEAEFTALYGEHGTESRFFHCNVWGDGSVCDACIAAAPHGTVARFWNNKCYCPECVAAAMAQNPRMVIRSEECLVDLSTGKIAPAFVIDGQYGLSWMIKEGGDVKFAPYGRKRRNTIAQRGYTYAHAEYLVMTTSRRDRDDWLITALSTPVVDDFGHSIATGEKVAESLAEQTDRERAELEAERQARFAAHGLCAHGFNPATCGYCNSPNAWARRP